MSVATPAQAAPATRWRPSAGAVTIVVLLVIACILPFVLDAFWLSTADFILIFAIAH